MRGFWKQICQIKIEYSSFAFHFCLPFRTYEQLHITKKLKEKFYSLSVCNETKNIKTLITFLKFLQIYWDESKKHTEIQDSVSNTFLQSFSPPIVKSYVTFALKQKLGTVSRISKVNENRLHTPAKELIILPPDFWWFQLTWCSQSHWVYVIQLHTCRTFSSCSLPINMSYLLCTATGVCCSTQASEKVHRHHSALSETAMGRNLRQLVCQEQENDKVFRTVSLRRIQFIHHPLPFCSKVLKI